MEITVNLVLGVAGSIVATLIVWIFSKWIKREYLDKRRNNKMLIEIGSKFYNEGLSKFHFSRDDYESTLSTFLDTANTSISIVSISLKVTQEEGRLTDLFKKKLAQNEHFIVTISLINPNNLELVKLAADTLDIRTEKLHSEVVDMLKDLLTCCQQLTSTERSRFKILVHDCFPMGSVIMLDATPTSGLIQLETKLYRSPRNESFGFQLTRESPFFKRNYAAWNRIIRDSKPIEKEDLVRRRIHNFEKAKQK